MAIYLKLGDAKGDVTEQAHTGQIEILDVQWSMSRTIRSAVGVGKQRESTSAYVSEVSLTKYIDSASSKVAQKAFSGVAEQQATIDFTRVDEGSEAVFRTITLKEPIISGLVNSGSSSGRPTEAITLNFTQIEIRDISETDAGSAGSPSTVDLRPRQGENQLIRRSAKPQSLRMQFVPQSPPMCRDRPARPGRLDRACRCVAVEGIGGDGSAAYGRARVVA